MASRRKRRRKRARTALTITPAARKPSWPELATTVIPALLVQLVIAGVKAVLGEHAGTGPG